MATSSPLRTKPTSPVLTPALVTHSPSATSRTVRRVGRGLARVVVWVGLVVLAVAVL